MTTAKANSVQIVASPWSGMGQRRCDCIVDADGSVLVYDSVAGHYTRCHILTQEDMDHVRRLWAQTNR